MQAEQSSLREYRGHGQVVFEHGETFDGDFQLIQSFNGHVTLSCPAPLSDDVKKVVNEEGNQDKKELHWATLRGKTSDAGEITISKMVLNTTSLTGRNGVVGVVFEFLVSQDVTIEYQPLQPTSAVTFMSGLTNFEFQGFEKSTYGLTTKWDKFTCSLDGHKFTFTQHLDYNERIASLKANGGANVTCEAVVIDRFESMTKIAQEITKSCVILSYASGNWVTTLYFDIYAEGKIAKTTLLPYKTYGFVSGETVIESVEGTVCNVGRFLEQSLSNYDELDGNLGLSIIIELYISALTQKLLEQRFLLAAVSFESLSSRIPAYANKKGDHLESGAIKATRMKIESWLAKYGLNCSDSQIEEITSQVAYKGIGIKDSLRYLFSKFNVVYDEEELNFVIVRSQIVHSAKYKGELAPKCLQLFDLLDRTILTVLGWKGKNYLRKTESFRPTVLS
jgi:hypothetical protein